jgi:hypothetical protein
LAATLFPIYAGLLIQYPPLSRFNNAAMREFYARISDAHPFDSFTLLGESHAAMITEDVSRLELDRWQLDFDMTTSEFDTFHSNAVDIVANAVEHFQIVQLRLDQVRLRAVVVADDETPLGDVVPDQLVRLSAAQYGRLGDVEGVGLRVTGDHPAEEMGWQVEIEPYYANRNLLYIACTTQPYGEPRESIDSYLHASYRFLTDNVREFINPFLPGS